MVAGAASLVWSVNPTLSATEVRNILITAQSSQSEIGNCGDGLVPAHILNVGAAVNVACGLPGANSSVCIR